MHSATPAAPASAQLRIIELVELRRARPEDAVALARVHVKSWQAAYRGLLPLDYLERLDMSQRRDGWKRILAHFRREGRYQISKDAPYSVRHLRRCIKPTKGDVKRED